MWIATVNTGNYDWVAIAETAAEAKEALVEAYAAHCAEYAKHPADIQPAATLMVELIKDGCVNTHPITPGIALRDGQPIRSV